MLVSIISHRLHITLIEICRLMLVLYAYSIINMRNNMMLLGILIEMQQNIDCVSSRTPFPFPDK